MSESSSRLDLIQRAMKLKGNASPRSDRVLPPTVEAEHRLPAVAERQASAEKTIPEPKQHDRADWQVKLNYARLRESKIALPGDKHSVTYNEFRSIKRKLLPVVMKSNGTKNRQNVVMVTSALPSEGKTFSSINLAIALAAEKNLDVILIDGDVIKGSLRGYFSGATDRGLTDLFGNPPATIDTVLHHCAELPNLHLVFSGGQSDSAPEQFASSRMAEVFDAVSRRYPQSVIIVDSPPVLATSEPAGLVTHIDHLIMVVAAGRSSRAQVESSLTALSSCRSIFLLFNKAPKWQQVSQGSYYYYTSPAP